MELITKDKKIKPLLEKARQHGNIDSCLKRIADTVPIEDQKMIATTFLEYVTKYHLYNPVARDSLLAAVVFWYESLNPETSDELKVKFYDRYLNTMKSLKILDWEKLITEISRRIEQDAKQAKVVAATIVKEP